MGRIILLKRCMPGILRLMRNENSDYPNFLDKHDPAFVRFQTALDNTFRQLRASGIGTESGHTEGISRDEENQLWSSGNNFKLTVKNLLKMLSRYQNIQ